MKSCQRRVADRTSTKAHSYGDCLVIIVGRLFRVKVLGDHIGTVDCSCNDATVTGQPSSWLDTQFPVSQNLLLKNRIMAVIKIPHTVAQTQRILACLSKYKIGW